MTEQAQLYYIIFYICIALATGTFILSVTLFFTLRIPKVIGDITGRTARKATKEIRVASEHAEDRVYRTNKERVNSKKVKVSGDETVLLAEETAVLKGTGEPTQELRIKEEIYKEDMIIVEDITIINSDVTI